MLYYVYLLRSRSNPSRHYTGFTTNLKSRLNDHNNGLVTHTAKYRPWEIDVYVAFRSRDRAEAFESYLKSHSGRSFASRHF